MSYEPPTKKDYSICLEYYVEAYDEGYAAAQQGASEKDNPYEESGHERDTTFKDELHYQWWRGYNDWEAKASN